MANDKLLLNDGSSFVLLNDGTSVVLLNSETGAVGGFTLSGTHSGVSLIGPRPKQEIPVEFTFLIRADILKLLKNQIRLIAFVRKEVKSVLKLKAEILKPVEEHFHIKANILKKLKPLGYKIEENTIKLKSRSTIKTLKNKLYENLNDMLRYE